MVSRLLPEYAETRAHLALRLAFSAFPAFVGLMPGTPRSAFEMPKPGMPVVMFHPAFDFVDARDDFWLNLRVVREPMFLRSQLEELREPENMRPHISAARLGEQRMIPQSTLALTPRTIHGCSRDDLRAKIPAPLGRDLLPVPLLEGKDPQGLFNGNHVPRSAATTRSEVPVPEITHRVETLKDGGKQSGVCLTPSGVAQHILTFPAALDGRDQLVRRRMAAAAFESVEFAAQGTEMFFGVGLIVEHVEG